MTDPKVRPEPRKLLEEVLRLQNACFEVERLIPPGEVERRLLYQARCKMGEVEHVLKVELGLRK